MTRSNGVRPLKGVSNFRDVGGMATVDGRVLKTGVLFRSGELSRLSRRDRARLQELGLRVICDLRGSEESERRRPRLEGAGGTRLVNIALHGEATAASRKKLRGFLFAEHGEREFRQFSRDYYHHMAFAQQGRVRQVLTLLSQTDNLPALVHCAAGKDRTGFVVALIQLLVGVPFDLVLADYLRSNDLLAPKVARFIKVIRFATLFRVSEDRLRVVLMTHPDFLSEIYGKILADYGSVQSYVRDGCGVEDGVVDALRARMLP